MDLSTLDTDQINPIIDRYRSTICHDPLALSVFELIVSPTPPSDVTRLAISREWSMQANTLVETFGMKTEATNPHDGITYDGTVVAAKIEPCVVIHEVGHYQCAAPLRRHVPDFGLGPGVVTGESGTPLAKQVQTVFGDDADVEEALSSLLGIAWEAELGQPAILFFLDQEWLETGPRGRDAAHFIKVVHWLRRWNVIDDHGHPTRNLRDMSDDDFFREWHSQPATTSGGTTVGSSH